MPIGLRWDNEKGVCRWMTTEAGALAHDESLETAVLLSLFTNAPATAEELAAARQAEQLGWWADADTNRPAGGRIVGSKLWLLQRGKTTLATLRLAEQCCIDALAWLIEAKIAAEVQVLATRPQLGVLQIDLKIRRPQKLLPPFERLWRVRTNAVL